MTDLVRRGPRVVRGRSKAISHKITYNQISYLAQAMEPATGFEPVIKNRAPQPPSRPRGPFAHLLVRWPWLRSLCGYAREHIFPRPRECFVWTWDP